MMLEESIHIAVTYKYSTFPHASKFIELSSQQREIFKLVNFIFLSSFIGLAGIVANVINITVFYKQGFAVTINIAFFALAISDLLCLITLQWFNICMNPLFEKAHLPFVPGEVQYLIGGWLHVCFSRITGWITVFITAERCLGISLPLRVKYIVTTRKTVFTMFLIFFINLLTLSPDYCVSFLDWKFYPDKNRTIVGILTRSGKESEESLVFIFTSTSGIISFVVVVILTIILVTKLGKKSKWRRSATSENEQSERLFTRDKKTMKMVVLIATVLIICYAPGTAISMVTIFEPEFHLIGKYMNVFFATWSFAFVFQAVNSSVNIFLYYNMSSKYRQTFQGVFFINNGNYADIRTDIVTSVGLGISIKQ